MPRIHDFSKDPSRSEPDYIWNLFRERTLGRGEVAEAILWGPGGIFLFDGVHHQFDLRTPAGRSPYDNDLVDPVYRWLEENMSGPWNWLERQTNNYRSVATSVYIRDDADIEAFKAKWGGIFEYDESYTRRNANWVGAEIDAQERGVMPGYVRASSMHHILMAMSVSNSSADWLDNFRDRIGFDDLLAEGLQKAVARALEAEPSEYGAKLTDGQWNEKLVAAFAAVGEWIREKAPESLRERLKGYDAGDEALTEAIGLTADAPAVSR
jgi:hypothetical protein